MLLFENLDLTPIHFILWTGLHRHGQERPAEYQPEQDLKALMPRQLLQKKGLLTVEKRLFQYYKIGGFSISQINDLRVCARFRARYYVFFK